MLDNDFAAIGSADPNLSSASLRGGEKEEDVLLDGQKAVQKEIHGIAIRALRFGAAMIAALVLVRLWHMAAPECWRWLTDADLQGMDKILFSSAFGGLVLSYLKEIMKPIPR